jgi:hypothetical protein
LRFSFLFQGAGYQRRVGTQQRGVHERSFWAGSAYNDRRGRRAKARDHALDPVRGSVANPATMLPAVHADQLAGMRPFAGTDGADVAATRSIAINGTVELDAQADEWRLPLCDKQVELLAPQRGRSVPGVAPPSC